MCAHGGIYTLTGCRSRFRLRNYITSCEPERKGSKNTTKYIQNLMSPAMIAANTARGLHKPSKADQKEAKRATAGKHNQNVGGHALDLDGLWASGQLELLLAHWVNTVYTCL